MPSCLECNKKIGKIEEELLIKFGLCIKPFENESIGVAEKVLNALSPKRGRSSKDRRIRKRKRKQVLSQMVAPRNIPLASIMPPFGFHNGVKPEEERGVLVSEKDLKSFGEKIIRGTTYVIDYLYIEKEYDIGVYFLHDYDAKQIIDVLKKFGVEHRIGPGIRIIRAIVPEDIRCGIYCIETWGQFKFYGAVQHKEEKKACRIKRFR